MPPPLFKGQIVKNKPLVSYRKNATSREEKTEETAGPEAVQKRTGTSRDANNKMVVSTSGNGMLQEHGHKRQVHYCKATAGAPETVETLVVEGTSSAAWMVATEEILATASITGQSTALSTAAATG